MAVTIVSSEGRRLVEACGKTILEVLREQGIGFAAPCGGKRNCGKCQVLVRDGSGLHYVLACRTDVEDGMEIHVGAQAMVVQNAGALAGAGWLQTRNAENAESGEVAWGIASKKRSRSVCRSSADGALPVADGACVRAGYGLAVDIGTTTLVCRLHNLASAELLASVGRVNPQVIYGADVVARIDASMGGHLDDMCDLMRNTVADMVDALCENVGVERSALGDVVVAGNTVMEHIAARVSPDSIGVAPYEPSSYFGGSCEFGPISARAYFAPAIAGYVGGDVAAGILAAGMHEEQRVQIYLDLGTNGEVVLGNAEGLVACATAAGPVFEGASIRCGMPAQEGAIAHVTCDGESLKLSVIGGSDVAGDADGAEKAGRCEAGAAAAGGMHESGAVEAVGICGSGLIEAVAFMLDQGIIDETGRMHSAGEVPVRWFDRASDVGEKHAFFLDGQRKVYITQDDIRNVQLAKAAICAGIQTLLEERGLSVGQVDSLIIAGGFGSFLDVGAAARIGLFPSELSGCARSVGNMAIEGASLLLISPEARETVCEIVSACEYVELSASVAFSKRYLECMMF